MANAFPADQTVTTSMKQLYSTRGVCVDPRATSPENGFNVQKLQNGHWQIQVSAMDLLVGRESQSEDVSGWTAITLFVHLDERLRVLSKDVFRTSFDAVACLSFKGADKILRQQRLNLYSGLSETAAMLKAAHEFGFALHNARMSSPRMIYDGKQQKFFFAQGTNHRISDVRDFTSEQTVREIMRWANAMMTEVTTGHRIPVQFYNQGLRIETPLGFLDGEFYKVGDVQQALNVARQKLIQAKVEMGVEKGILDSNDIKITYMPPNISTRSQGNLILGVDSYGRFFNTSELDGRRNLLSIAIMQTFGRTLVATEEFQEYLMATTANSKYLDINSVRDWHDRVVSQIIKGRYVPVQKISETTATAAPTATTSVETYTAYKEIDTAANQADQQEKQQRRAIDSSMVRHPVYGNLKMPAIRDSGAAQPDLDLARLGVFQRLNGLYVTWGKREERRLENIDLTRVTLKVGGGELFKPIEAAGYGNNAHEARAHAAKLALAMVSPTNTYVKDLLDRQGQVADVDQITKEVMGNDKYRLMNGTKNGIAESRIEFTGKLPLKGYGVNAEEAFRNAVMELAFEYGRDANQQEKTTTQTRSVAVVQDVLVSSGSDMGTYSATSMFNAELDPAIVERGTVPVYTPIIEGDLSATMTTGDARAWERRAEAQPANTDDVERSLEELRSAFSRFDAMYIDGDEDMIASSSSRQLLAAQREKKRA